MKNIDMSKDLINYYCMDTLKANFDPITNRISVTVKDPTGAKVGSLYSVTIDPSDQTKLDEETLLCIEKFKVELFNGKFYVYQG